MLDQFIKSRSRSLRDFSTDDILSALGLERRSTPIEAAFPTALAFVAGIAAGAGVALLLAPKSGREVRRDISDRASQLTSRASELTSRLASSANDLASEVRNALPIGESQSRTTGTATATGAGTGTDTTRSLGGTNRTS